MKQDGRVLEVESLVQPLHVTQPPALRVPDSPRALARIEAFNVVTGLQIAKEGLELDVILYIVWPGVLHGVAHWPLASASGSGAYA